MSMIPIQLSFLLEAFIPQVFQFPPWSYDIAPLTTLRPSQDLCIPASHPNLSPQSPQSPRTFWLYHDQQPPQPTEIYLWGM